MRGRVAQTRELYNSVGFHGVVLATVQDLTIPIHEPENVGDSWGDSWA